MTERRRSYSGTLCIIALKTPIIQNAVNAQMRRKQLKSLKKITHSSSIAIIELN